MLLRLIFAMVFLSLVACSEDSDSDSDDLLPLLLLDGDPLFPTTDPTPTPTPSPSGVTVNPSNPDDISGVLVIPGSSTVGGDAPAPSVESGAPAIVSNLERGTITPGGTVNLSLGVSATDGYQGCYVQVDGATEYFDIPSDSPGFTSGELQVPVSLPQNIEFSQESEFCVWVCIVDNTGLVSNYVQTCIDTLNVGTGDMQVSLSWNTTADMDLHVVEPDANEIYFGNKGPSSNGGELDVDDTDGLGPENIFWSNPSDGTYTVSVDHWSGASPTSVTVTVNAFGASQTFTRTISSGEEPTIATISVSGGSATITGL